MVNPDVHYTSQQFSELKYRFMYNELKPVDSELEDRFMYS